MNLVPDLAVPLPRIDDRTPDATLLAVIGRGERDDRAAAGLLYERHAARLRAAALAELADHSVDAADEIVHDVFLSLLFGVATTFDQARDDALPWLEEVTRRTAVEHLRAGVFDRLERAA